MNQYISSNKENQINRPIIDRTPLSTIKGGSNNNNNNNNVLKQQKSNSSSSASASALQSRVIIAKQEHSLENALKKIKELEAQVKEKDQVIADLKNQNQILVDSFSEDQKINTRINNNRIRKITQLTLSNQLLQDKLDESLFKNDKNDKVNSMQNNNRIRLIQKLKLENNELKQQIKQQQQQQQDNHHKHQHQHSEHHNEQLSNVNRSTIISEPAQSIKEIQTPSSSVLSFSSNYYGLEDHDEHVGEC